MGPPVISDLIQDLQIVDSYHYWSSWSKKTLLMHTPKCLGDQIWQMKCSGRPSPLFKTARAESELFGVQWRKWEPIRNSQLIRKYKEIPVQIYRDTDTKGRWTPPVNTARAQSDLFTVQCCHWDSKADGPPKSTLSEHRVISSLFTVVIETKWEPIRNSQLIRKYKEIPVQIYRDTDTKDRWTPPVNTARAQSDLFTVQCCQWDSKADGPPWWTLPEHRVISSLFNVVSETQRQMDPPVNTVRAQSDLFTVHCCHWDSQADGPPQSTLPEHRVISALFNVVSETQRQMDPPGEHCQSTEWSLHCSILSVRLKGRWTPQSILSEHRVISSLFTVVIETHRQMDPPVNNARAQSDLCTVQCCQWDSKADGPPSQYCQSTEWSLHCSLLSLRLTGRWTPPVNTARAQSDLCTVQCCQWDSKADGPPPVNTVRAQSDLFTVHCCHWD